ncbi:GxxExxY protein [Chitinispirillales bacterium ANBcel5]|uniref:GxxExxY protein n=1 Tax=Cellulosispirillum alkaliphilum TaxID=3039283 RepID=UPI002A54A9B9|nr:GxxExxY protein [Chitinispirillales bacterium ANBcel5]
MSIEDPLTHRIIGCAMNVHNFLGNGFQEVIYQRALEIEFKEDGIHYTREQEVPIFYKECLIGKRRVDFLVENRIMVELKAVLELEDVHLAQGLNYLTAYNLEIGLLINFGGTRLVFKRLFRKNRSFPSGEKVESI